MLGRMIYRKGNPYCSVIKGEKFILSDNTLVINPDKSTRAEYKKILKDNDKPSKQPVH